MDLKKYFAGWDVEIAQTYDLREPQKTRTAAKIMQAADRNYTRRVLRSGCVLLCLKGRSPFIGHGSPSS